MNAKAERIAKLIRKLNSAFLVRKRSGRPVEHLIARSRKLSQAYLACQDY